MPLLVHDCPRCGSSKITFDVLATILVRVSFGWRHEFEAFTKCRHCGTSTVFALAQRTPEAVRWFEQHSPMEIKGTVNDLLDVMGYVSQKDMAVEAPPEHLNDPVIANAFREGAVCIATQCWNAAGTMFRLTLDLATRPMLPPEEQDVDGLNRRARRDLAPRLKWLFDNGKLPADLRELSTCVREDGNDGAHAGTLTEEDAEDLLDFARAFLERIYSEPERIRLAKERRSARRKPRE